VEWTVAIGVDTHRDLHVAVALDRLGRRLGSLELAVDERGFAQLVRFVRSLGEPAFAVEGSGSYGASLARALVLEGFPVYECDRPERRRRLDKNDLIDAEAAGRQLLTGKRLPLPRGGGERERLRLLLLERRSAQQGRQQASNHCRRRSSPSTRLCGHDSRGGGRRRSPAAASCRDTPSSHPCAAWRSGSCCSSESWPRSTASSPS
jgi:transposase